MSIVGPRPLLISYYPADEARRIMKRLEIHYTPKHAMCVNGIMDCEVYEFY